MIQSTTCSLEQPKGSFQSGLRTKSSQRKDWILFRPGLMKFPHCQILEDCLEISSLTMVDTPLHNGKILFFFFPMYSLEGVLPEVHLHYWQSFVLACRLLCKPRLTKADLMLADCKLLEFLKEYQRINGKLAITPNMHLHLHLKECVENFGSNYGVWLFSFERYNGILGSYQTNRKTVEIQIMRKFMMSGSLAHMQYSLPVEYKDFFLLNCMAQLDSTGDTVTLPQLMMASSGCLLGK